MPDFEVDLSERQVPRGSSFDRSIVSGVILLVVAVAAIAALVTYLIS
jgi:hypothetical protein